ncbi:mechanosensitive ion channel family protein [Hespellia stercorisuis]|uniref:Small conductance mechanosensitive channel n=1 Tax=Hespellia stercorisuis DSM 15480 TaxID=1121950 RepID=A0A1M6NPF8_9FIRM|nr:mechanosensitive ion channel domain-containing protein [Hespellia stercorisuis]SHJ97550.1 small conductance mechanosensitive channel [Hespellia stercorisuis DSM 15480]
MNLLGTILLAETTLPGATEVVEDAADSMNEFQIYVRDSIPALLAFGVKVVLAIVFFLIGKQIIKWIRKVTRKSMEFHNADTGVKQFVDSLLKFGLYLLLIMIIATMLGVESTSAAALLASGGVAIGLALQGSLSNLAGGVLILLLKPFVVGDYIIEDTNKNEGVVKEIQIFYTKLTTVDNKTIVIPNGTLANNSLINLTAKEERKIDLKVGISYDADLKKAKALIEEMLQVDEEVIKNEEQLVFVDSLSDSAVIIGIRAWVKTENYWKVRWGLLEKIKLSFDENHIEIPYKQLTVHMAPGESRE